MSARTFSDLEVVAATHPAAYRFHKYWARKPHNVVRRALEACGVREGSVVLDPFCGSGVPLSEAAALGARVHGFDVNPVAVELTRATLAPPDPDAYFAAMSALLDQVAATHGARYRVEGREERFTVHATVVACACGARVSADSAPRRGRTYTCPSCGRRLAFNLEALVETRPLRTALTDGAVMPSREASVARSSTCSSPHDRPIAANARILAHPGMRTRDLFTPRNFEVLTDLATRADALPDPLRRAALLTVTAAAAQCSRLVPFRQDLTTGGPAWTVPGFWVPPLHVETNPLLHLRLSATRARKAFVELARMKGRGGDADVTLGSVERVGNALPRVDVVFLDPPYGDSVPYVEFSTVWNAFLGADPDPGADLAVSDRSRGDGTWERYARGLEQTVGAAVASLAGDGRLLVTFNNKDPRAWGALLVALERASLSCDGAFHQRPAVISTKAQLAPAGSYLGDVYARFVRRRDGNASSREVIEAALARAGMRLPRASAPA